MGREYEIAGARNLLQGNRLLTLTGPGGCGKTRLAIALAAGVTDHFAQGVQFVSLAAIRDPSLVPVSIAQSIGLQDARGRSLLEHLSGYVGDGDVLLILDNFEQVLAAGEFVSELLDATGRLRVLVTSRSPLHVSGEQEFPVPPLALPEGGPGTTAAAVAGCESVRLFAERAAASVPGFTVNDQNAGAVAGIVDRLDGLPLAIELAAARVKLLPPAEILARLDNSLGLLVSGSRDLPARQRTLRATIAWSYELLSDSARQLLAACSVFRGGIALVVIESVCAEAAGLRTPVLDAAGELVDHSLLRQAAPAPGGGPRFVMLESVREFAAGGWPSCRCTSGLERRTQGRSRPWCRIWPVRRCGRTGQAWICSSSSTTTSGLRWISTAGRTRPARCGWPTGSRPSGPRAAISRRDGGAWATCSTWSRTTTSGGWMP